MSSRKNLATLIGFIALLLTSCSSTAQQTNSHVKIVGEMKNVLWKG